MKKILLLLGLFIVTNSLRGQVVYSPSTHTVVSKPLGMPKNATDARSQFYEVGHFVYRDYVSTAEVLSYLTTANFRSGKFPIFVNSTGSLNTSTGVITGGTPVEYWFKDGTADINLVIKQGVSSGITSFNGRIGGVILNGTDVTTALGFNPLSSSYTGYDIRYAGIDSVYKKNHIDSLSFVYQQKENQRLSTTNSVTFAGITSAINAADYTAATGMTLKYTNPSGDIFNYIFRGRTPLHSGEAGTRNIVLDFPVVGGSIIRDVDVTIQPLTGLSLATATVITSADNLLTSSGKLQAQITGLSTVYQQKENQRLSTTNLPIFAGITSTNQLTITTNSGTLNTFSTISNATIGVEEQLVKYSIGNITTGSDSWYITGLPAAGSGINNIYNLKLPAKNGTLATTGDIAPTSSTVVTGQTGAITILSLAVTATSVFEVGCILTVTSISGGNLNSTLTYTDENNTSNTIQMSTGLTSVQQDSNLKTIKAKSGTNIVIATTLTGTVTYNGTAYIQFKY